MKNKLKYETADFEVVMFDSTDIITTSGKEYDEGNIESGGWVQKDGWS